MSAWLVLTVGFGFAILTGVWLGWQLLRQNGRILLRLDELEKRLNELEFGGEEEPAGLPLGSEAPGFELADLAGERKSLAQFRGQPVLLIFFNPGCGFCREMMPKLREKAESEKQKAETEIGGRSEQPLVIIVSTGDAEMNRQFFAEHKVDCPVLLQTDGEVAKAYQAHGTPSGYLITPDGKVASELAMGAEALLVLAECGSVSRLQPAGATNGGPGYAALTDEPATGEPAKAGTPNDGRASRFGNRSLAKSKIKRDGLKAGTPAPDFRLPRLDGRGELALSELRGKRVLLVFSSPDCGPCNALSPELEKFHREHPDLEMVMISKGEPKENRAKVKEHRLTFPVVLQQQWEISRRYAMFATPIAYLINEQGLIANDVAVGTEPIMELLGRAELVES